MAKKKAKAEAKVELKRTYNIPLRKEFMKAPKWKRTNRAVKALRHFLIRHMKATEVKLGKALNEHMWKHGIRNPPHHVKVDAEKDSEGIVRAELAGAPLIVEDKRFKKKKALKKEKKGEEKKEEKTGKKVEEKKEEAVEQIEEEKDIKEEIKAEETTKPVKTAIRHVSVRKKEGKQLYAKGPKTEVPKAEDLVKKKGKK